VTSPQGFLAGAATAGLRELKQGAPDIALLYSEQPCAAAAVFTQNRVKAAPVLLSQRHLADGRSQAVVANAGCANACTGEQGLRDAREMAELTARRLGVAVEDVVVASTGVTGCTLPMDSIRNPLLTIEPSRDGGESFARAIMTTDKVPKLAAAAFSAGSRRYVVGGCAKGSGMIHPNMATMLAFLTTDAPIEPAFLRQVLDEAVVVSFNMVTVDGDTSPNDMALVMANGVAGGEAIGAGHEAAPLFRQALRSTCVHLAKGLARDAEGATKLIEVRVEGATSEADARRAARAVAGSMLVKAAVYGCDPNWGRILVAAGYSGADLREETTSLYLQDACLLARGRLQPVDEASLRSALADPDVSIRLDLGLGQGRATAWGCDLTEDYVRVNSKYTT
jgi:glutamate N-acetyltransferase/amino-acid N-acetyltransferase